MGTTACWMFNTLDVCGWVSFGYGSRFDTQRFWISHAGLMHLAKFHDFELFSHPFGREDCTPFRHAHDCAYSRSIVNWKKQMNQSAIRISIPGYEELEEVWFNNFYIEVENYNNNDNLPWSFDGDHWFKYPGWKRIQKFGNDWVSIQRMYDMYELANSYPKPSLFESILVNFDDELEEKYEPLQVSVQRTTPSVHGESSYDYSVPEVELTSAYDSPESTYNGSWTVRSTPQQDAYFCIFGGQMTHYHFGKHQNPNVMLSSHDNHFRMSDQTVMDPILGTWKYPIYDDYLEYDYSRNYDL